MQIDAATILFLVLSSVGLGADQHAATVRLGTGCSGVCVDPTGIVLTAKHCGTPERTQVTFPKLGTHAATLVHAGADGDDVVAYDVVGDGWPFVDVSQVKPEPGESVWSLGYPQRAGFSQVRAAGKLYGVGPIQVYDPKGGWLRATVNGVTFRTGPGWSGGPLFNDTGEVVGILSAENEQGSVFLSHGGTRAVFNRAMQAKKTPRLRYFGFDACVPCRLFKADAKAGRFGRVLSGDLKKHGDVLTTERYVIEYVDVATKEGRAKWDRLCAALKTMGKPVPKTVPTFHLEGRAATTSGYDTPKTRGQGFRRLGGWLLETLRLPLTIGEGVVGAITPKPADEPLPVDFSEDMLAEPNLGDPLPDVADDGTDVALVPDPPEPEQPPEPPVPWGGGLTGVGLALLELWKRKAA